MRIESPCVVSLVWRLTDAQGQLIDELKEPMEFFYGGDDLLEKVEEVLSGQAIGFTANLHLDPEQAFGDYIPELVFFEKRSVFPDGVEVGMQFDSLPEGAATPGLPADAIYTVTEVYPEHVVLDGNHPLAGIALNLDLAVRDVRDATDEEIEAGTVGQPVFSVVGSTAGSSTLH